MGYDSNYFEASRPEMHAFLPEQFSTALEIGCGDGGFWRGYKTDAEVWGIEPDPRAAETSRESMKTVFNDLYDRAEAELPDGYFDLVLCNDVIEHMVDHDRFFEQIKKKLSPNGVLVVSLPNVRYYRHFRDYLFSGDWEYQDAGILDRTHLRFFTRKSIINTIALHGYEIQSMQGINGGGFKLFPLLLNILLFGSARDVRHPQYAFRISPKK